MKMFIKPKQKKKKITLIASILNLVKELRKIGLFLRYPESIDVQNGLPQCGHDCCR